MVGLATCEVLEVIAPPFPKWYLEAPSEDSESDVLMDEVRTALLDYEFPEHIERLELGCVVVFCTGSLTAISVTEHLTRKGFYFTVYEKFPTFVDEIQERGWTFCMVKGRR